MGSWIDPRSNYTQQLRFIVICTVSNLIPCSMEQSNIFLERYFLSVRIGTNHRGMADQKVSKLSLVRERELWSTEHLGYYRTHGGGEWKDPRKWQRIPGRENECRFMGIWGQKIWLLISDLLAAWDRRDKLKARAAAGRNVNFRKSQTTEGNYFVLVPKINTKICWFEGKTSVARVLYDNSNT